MARRLKVFNKRSEQNSADNKINSNKRNTDDRKRKKKDSKNFAGKFSNERKYSGYIEILKSGRRISTRVSGRTK